MFQRWLRLLVNHWAALDIISAHASKSSYDIKLRLITAKHPDTYSDQGMKMNPWRDTIRRLTGYFEAYPQSLEPPNVFNAEVTISVLEKYLEDNKTPHHPIITAFNYEPGNPNKFVGNYHCEALLAAIITLGLTHNDLPGFLGEV
jgi:hypothetical protein